MIKLTHIPTYEEDVLFLKLIDNNSSVLRREIQTWSPTLEKKINVLMLPELIYGGEGEERSMHDAINIERLFTALKLSPSQALDSAFWNYLSCVVYRDYMSYRWPFYTPNGNETNIDIRRYLNKGSGNRDYQRHGISRLWWFGYLGFNRKNTEDPFNSIKILFRNQDFAASVFERSLGQNNNLVHALARIVESHNLNKLAFRDVAKFLNLMGGHTVLSALDISSLVKLAETALQYSDKFNFTNSSEIEI